MGLPGWLEEMMSPGVGSKAFFTLKLSLVALIACLCAMLSIVSDEDIRIHLKVFLGMSAVLVVLVSWFVGELQSAQQEKAARVEKTK